VQAMKEALRDGTIDAIATDHAPHATFEKEVEYIDAPFGIAGLETAVGLCITELVVPGHLALADLIEKLSSNPRRILNLPAVRIEAGMEANLTFLDMNAEWIVDASKFKSLSTNTPFNGRALKGKAFGIFNKGCFVQV
jgi:dihydroorotase